MSGRRREAQASSSQPATFRLLRPIVAEDSADLEGAARGGVVTFVALIVNAIFGFGFITLVSHSLPLAAAGGFFEAMALWTIASTMAVLGADMGLMRSLPLSRRRGPAETRQLVYLASVPVLLASLVIAAVLFALAPDIARAVVGARLQGTTTLQLRLLAPLVPFGALSTVLLAGSRAWRMGPAVTVQYIVLPIVRPLMFGIVAAFGITAAGVAEAWGVPVVLVAGASLVVITAAVRSDELSWGPAKRRPAEDARAVFRRFWLFAAPRSVEGVLLVLLSWLDVVLVGALASSRQAAPYAGAMRYVLLAGFALQAVSLVVAPRVSDLTQRQHRPEDTLQLYQLSTIWVVVISFPALLTLTALAPTLMSVFGHGYEAGAPALMILALSMLFNSGTGSNGMFLLMSGRSRVNLMITAVSLISNVALNLVLIPVMGLTGAAIAFAVSTFITALAMSLALWRVSKLQPFTKGYWIAVIGSLLCFGLPGLAVRLLANGSLVAIGAFIAFALVGYGVWLTRFRSALRLDLFVGATRAARTPGPGEPSPDTLR